MKKPTLYNFDEIRDKKQYWQMQINKANYHLKEWEKKENELRRKYSELVIIKNNLQIPNNLNILDRGFVDMFYHKIKNPCNMCKLENYNINSDLCNWCYQIIENENTRHTNYIMEKYKNE